MMTAVLTPVNLTLLLVAVGCLFGGIRCKGFSLGIVCVLFVAIWAGVLLRPLTVSNEVYGEQLIAAMQTFSALGTSVFVAVTGLCAGLSFAHGSRGGGIAFLVGCLMSCAGYTVIRIIDILDPSISCSVQGGILCGALTSTPGLSSICERPGMVASQAVRGYGCTYLGGVLSAVFAVRLCRTQKTEVREAAQAECADGKRLRAAPCVTVIGVCALFGNLLGSLILPGTGVMLGATGGILGTAMLLGCGLSKGKYVPEPSVLRIGKNLGLALFFTGTGVSAGLQIHALQPMTVLYGLLVTWTALAVGFFCTGRFFGRFHLHRGCVIAGGMTSSPALGTLLQKCADPPLFQFSAAYFGALLSLTVLLYFL